MVDKRVAGWVLFGVGVVIVGCSSSTSSSSSSSSGGADAGAGPTPQAACAAVWKARCTKLASCSTSAIAIRYGDEATCEARETQNCLTALAAPSTGNSPTAAEACATALGGNVDCTAFLVDTAPAECVQKTGALANGAGCAFNAQCTSGYCAVGAGSVCATCQPTPTAGAACDTAFCGPGLLCGAIAKTCGTAVATSASCEASPCGVDAVCAGAVGSKTCVPIVTTATTGQPCGLVNNGRVVCAAQGFCNVPTGQTAGTCVAAADDGSACDLTNGPRCKLPARCVSGTCQLPGATTCP